MIWDRKWYQYIISICPRELASGSFEVTRKVSELNTKILQSLNVPAVKLFFQEQSLHVFKLDHRWHTAYASMRFIKTGCIIAKFLKKSQNHKITLKQNLTCRFYLSVLIQKTQFAMTDYVERQVCFKNRIWLHKIYQLA